MKRSPNFPNMPLRDAVDHIRTAYPKAHRHKTPKDAMARLFGYTSLNGSSLTFLGALNQYGLLEGRKDSVGISQLGESLAIDPVGSSEWLATLKQCAFAPTVFQEIVTHFGGRLPADELVRPYLIRRGFSATGVDSVIRVIRDNLEFMEQQNTAYTPPETKKDAETPGDDPPPPKTEPPRVASTPEVSGMRQDKFSMAEGIATLEWPAQISAESAQDIEDWLGLVMRKIKRAVNAPPREDEGARTDDSSQG